jgi:hypothetical protein
VHINIPECICHEIKPRPEVARERVIEIKLLVETSLQWEAVLTWVAHDFITAYKITGMVPYNRPCPVIPSSITMCHS